MKILVDKMPLTTGECPYCIDKSTMDRNEYRCTWQGAVHYCEIVFGCPYFASIDDERENK